MRHLFIIFSLSRHGADEVSGNLHRDSTTARFIHRDSWYNHEPAGMLLIFENTA